MAALNFPDALSDGQTFEADTGVIYVYQGIPPAGFWSATNTVNGQQNQDARYVQRAGDDMTGNLTFNTDKIQLKAQDGSAEFAGDVHIKDYLAITTTRSGSQPAFILNSADGNDTVNINADGSASFTTANHGGVSFSQSGGQPTQSNSEIGFRINTDAIFGYEGAGPSTIEIRNDGSAVFAGGVTGSYLVSNNGGIDVLLSGNNVNNDGARLVPGSDGDNDPKLLLNKGGTTTVTLNGGDGSASFAGNVGIGTTSPVRNLQLGDNTSSAEVISLQTTTAGNGSIYFGDNTATSGEYAGVLRYSHSDNAMQFWTSSSESMRIDSSGRLLVGTSSSSSNTSAVFQANSASSTGAGVIQIARGQTFTAADTNVGNLEFTDSNGNMFGQINCTSDAAVTTGSDHPGRLVFKTTDEGASIPTERMRIKADGSTRTFSSSTGLVLSTAKAAGTSTSLIWGRHSATAVNTGTGSFYVWSNGDVQNTNNNYGAISDIKLKENIVDASSQWDDLKALQVRNYNFKEGQTHTQIGLVAQEAELVSPGLVSESPDFDEDGNDLGTVTKSVNYSVLYMKAVKALQEAIAKIETLEAKVAALQILKTASAAAADFAALKSAIATALADI